MDHAPGEAARPQPAATVLVVDDDAATLRLIVESLSKHGYRTLAAQDGQEALDLFFAQKPDLMVLDLGLPVVDGWTVCAHVRAVSNAPIIILSARGGLEDVVRGLEMGADDYVLKPFRVRELVARVSASLRRASSEPALSKSNLTYSDSQLAINLDDRRVTVNGKPVHLTPTEYRLLAELLAVTPRSVPYRDLLERVWGWEYVDDIDYLRVYIWHLRRKLEKDPRQPQYIINEHGVGYRFERHF